MLYTLDGPQEGDSPGQRYRDWDDFNLASWWDVESRRGRDYLDTHVPDVDFFTAVTDTTTSAYEETEDLEEDEEGEEGNIDSLLNCATAMPELVIKNGGRPQGPESFQLVPVNVNGVKSVSINSKKRSKCLSFRVFK